MYPDFKELLSVLNAHRVKYLVVGAYAVSIHAQPRATKDLDILVKADVDNAKAVFAALTQFGAPLRDLSAADFAEEGPFFRMGREPVGVDILTVIPGVEFDAAWQRRVEDVVDPASGLKATFISSEDLIAAKLAAGRPQDLADVEAIEKVRGLDLRARDAIIASTAAIFWGDETMIHNNGSMFFVDSGKALFAITARHVYDHYFELSKRRRFMSPCRIDDLPFDPIERLLCLGKGRIDIATFRFTRDELNRINRFPITWPPTAPEKDEFALFCGIPGEGRSQNQTIATFTHFVGKLRIDNVSEATLSFHRPSNDRLSDITGKGLPPEDLRMGGMSGGPMTVLRDSAEGKIWTLAGVVCEGNSTFIQGTRADLIRDNGSIEEVLGD